MKRLTVKFPLSIAMAQCVFAMCLRG